MPLTTIDTQMLGDSDGIRDNSSGNNHGSQFNNGSLYVYFLTGWLIFIVCGYCVYRIGRYKYDTTHHQPYTHISQNGSDIDVDIAVMTTNRLTDIASAGDERALHNQSNSSSQPNSGGTDVGRGDSDLPPHQTFIQTRESVETMPQPPPPPQNKNGDNQLILGRGAASEPMPSKRRIQSIKFVKNVSLKIAKSGDGYHSQHSQPSFLKKIKIPFTYAGSSTSISTHVKDHSSTEEDDSDAPVDIPTVYRIKFSESGEATNNNDRPKVIATTTVNASKQE